MEDPLKPRTHFDQEIKGLQDAILRLGGMVERNIYLAVEALKNRDLLAAEKVIDAGTPPAADHWQALEYPLTDYAGKTIAIVVKVSYGGKVSTMNEEAFFDEISVVQK